MPNYGSHYDSHGNVDPDFLKKPYKEKNTLIQNFSMVVPCRRWKNECPDQQSENDVSTTSFINDTPGFIPPGVP